MTYKSEYGSAKEAFEASFAIDETTGCWNWTRNIFSLRGGYGCFTHRPSGNIMKRAHRVSWALYRHPITQSEHVLHRCDNPKCVNPEHLFLGDQPLNMIDKTIKGRQNWGQTSGRRKLSEEQARAIYADTRLHAEIAAEYGISNVTVSDIKRGKSWFLLGLTPKRTHRFKVRA